MPGPRLRARAQRRHAAGYIPSTYFARTVDGPRLVGPNYEISFGENAPRIDGRDRRPPPGAAAGEQPADERRAGSAGRPVACGRPQAAQAPAGVGRHRALHRAPRPAQARARPDVLRRRALQAQHEPGQPAEAGRRARGPARGPRVLHGHRRQRRDHEGAGEGPGAPEGVHRAARRLPGRDRAGAHVAGARPLQVDDRPARGGAGLGMDRLLVITPHCSGQVPQDVLAQMLGDARDDLEARERLLRRVWLQGDPYTDVMFDVPGAVAVHATVSRFVVDVNRARDDAGPNGVVKATDIDAAPLYPPDREPDPTEVEETLRRY